MAVVRAGRWLRAEKASASTAMAHFVCRGFAHVVHTQIQPQAYAGQGVIAVKHHVVGVDVGYGVDAVSGHGGGAWRQGAGFNQHALFQPLREQRARLQKDEPFVKVAKSVLRLQAELQAPLAWPCRACSMRGSRSVPPTRNSTGLSSSSSTSPRVSLSVQVSATTH